MEKESSQDKLIVGLGNPGLAYARTRHNMGFLVVEALAKRKSLNFKLESKFGGQVAHGVIGESRVHLLLPMTYMNLSGQSVIRVVNFFKLHPSSVLVVADDVAIRFGQLRLRASGSDGGHQGLKSVQVSLNTPIYPRLRVGIGDRTHGALEEYVLGKFSKDEACQLDEICEKGADAIEIWLRERIDIAMNLINRP